MNMIKDTWKIPWELFDIIEEIQDLIGELRARIRHIYREANQLAHHLANKVVNHTHCMQFSRFVEQPSMVRRILKRDKHQVPPVKIKTRRFKVFPTTDRKQPH